MGGAPAEQRTRHRIRSARRGLGPEDQEVQILFQILFQILVLILVPILVLIRLNRQLLL